MVAERRQQNDAFQPQLSQQCIHLPPDLGAGTVPRLDHEMKGRLATTLHGPRLEFAQVVAGLVAEEPDEKRTVAGQTARVEVWPVIELLDGLQDPVARDLANRRLFVEYARYGLR